MALYKRLGIFYIKVKDPVTGKIIRKSTNTGNKTLARQVEKELTERLIKGQWSSQANKLTFESMAEAIKTDYRINNRRTIRSVDICIRNLSIVFKGRKAQDITEDAIKDFKLKRLAAGSSNDTVNLDLRILKRMFMLAFKGKKIHSVPSIDFLKGKTRMGFFTHEEFLALRGALPDYLKVLVILAYHTGMRKGELLSLKWNQVDLVNGKISLTAEQTKNETPRIIYLRGELLEAMLKQRDWILRSFPACEYVFTYDGRKLEGLKRQWLQTLKLLGMEGKKLHDFRRTALTNMTRAGIPQIIAQKISGHKNESVFRRYNIINEKDLENAAEIMANYQGKGHSLGHKLGHSNKNVAFSEDTENVNLLEVKGIFGAGERD